jgi:hypothetical protein
MKKGLLFVTTLISGLSFGQASDCSELFISEYCEGWSNNKALEIYNPTNQTVDLSQYFVARYNNGSTSNTSGATASIAIQLTGTVAPYSTHVGVLDKRDPMGTGQEAPIWDSLQIRADEFYCPVYADSYAFYWNGNDAVVLAKGNASDIANAIIVDIFGKIGEDPGTGWSSAFPYTGAGTVVTADHSLIRKPSIKKGETNPVISFFNPLLEYDSIPAVVDIGGQLYGNWFTLGEHSCDCEPAVIDENTVENVKVFPNPSNGVVYVKNIGPFENIEIVNALGQKIYSSSINGKSILSIDLSENKGVYFIRLSNESGDQIAKRVVIK